MQKKIFIIVDLLLLKKAFLDKSATKTKLENN